MKAITLWQPWASLLACGAKQYETRSRPINYRGPIAIHAGLRDAAELMSSKQINALIKSFAGTRYEVAHDRAGGGKDYIYPYGCIIATAELAGCYPIVEPARIEGMISTGKMVKPDIPVSVYGNELLFGDWTPGRYAWDFKNMTLLPEPIPAKGKQGLWNWVHPEEFEL